MSPAVATVVLAAIPSPDRGVWYLGPVPVRAYALCIIAGIVVAVLWSERRFVARGGEAGVVTDVAVWAVPFGLLGGRLYHVATDWRTYFGPGGDPLDALKIWQGGLGIWGAVALGGVGAWIGCRRRGVPLPFFADAVAPGIVAAQAIGRLGNWFNQELYGGPTTLPWGLEIYRRVDPDTGVADGLGGVALDRTPLEVVHPAFLYELLWNLLVAALVVWADRRFRLGHGRAFALYVAGYTAGRFWIELLRTDNATRVFGDVRINVVVSVVVFLGAVLYLALVRGPREVLAAPVPPVDEVDEVDEVADGSVDDAAERETVGVGSGSVATLARPTTRPAPPAVAVPPARVRLGKGGDGDGDDATPPAEEGSGPGTSEVGGSAAGETPPERADGPEPVAVEPPADGTKTGPAAAAAPAAPAVEPVGVEPSAVEPSPVEPAASTPDPVAADSTGGESVANEPAAPAAGSVSPTDGSPTDGSPATGSRTTGTTAPAAPPTSTGSSAVEPAPGPATSESGASGPVTTGAAAVGGAPPGPVETATVGTPSGGADTPPDPDPEAEAAGTDPAPAAATTGGTERAEDRDQVVAEPGESTR